jgi:hypothetical protein
VTGRVYPTIGIDPGQRWIGLAVRVDGRCLDAATLDRGPVPAKDEERYLGEAEADVATRLLDVIDAMMRRHLEAAEEAARGWDVPRLDLPWRVAMEGVVVTGAYERGRYDVGRRIAKLTSLIDVAVTVGVVVASYPGVVVVRPRRLGDRGHQRHGDILAKLGPYPKELLRVRPAWFAANQHPKGDRVHERSAWAVAGAAQLARPLTLAAVQQELVS